MVVAVAVAVVVDVVVDVVVVEVVVVVVVDKLAKDDKEAEDLKESMRDFISPSYSGSASWNSRRADTASKSAAALLTGHSSTEWPKATSIATPAMCEG